MKRKWIITAIILILAFVWFQSIIPESRSAHESDRFNTSVITPLLQRFGLSAIDREVIRKIAHITEYLVLGIFISILWKNRQVKSIYTGFTIAFLDESIQVLTGRGALITDVWIDLIGITAGTAIVWIVNNVIKHNGSK